MPSSTQRAAIPPLLLTPDDALPVSKGGSGPSGTEIAVTQGARYCFPFNTRIRIQPTITEDTSDSEDDSVDDSLDSADIADADVREELVDSRYNLTPDLDEGSGTPELTEHQTDRAGLAPPQGISALVDGNPGMPLPKMPQGPSVDELQQATSMASPWAPFNSVGPYFFNH